jgi:hypothetical protein
MGHGKLKTRAGGCDTEVVTPSGHIVSRDEPRPGPSETARPTDGPAEPTVLRFVPGLDGWRGVAAFAVMFWAGLSAAFIGLVLAALLVATVTPGEAALPIGSRPPAHFVGPAGVGAAHPEHALLLGDSLALTLGIGLSNHSRDWGITLDNQSAIGCDLDPDTTVNVMGTVSPAARGCPDWRTSWTRLVNQDRPDVVVVLLGRWECLDRLFAGSWTHVGEPVFDRHLVAELGQVIDIGSSHGAKVAMLTLPYIVQTTEQPDGSPWDMNLPARTNAYNADVRRAVAEHAHQAAVIGLNKLLDPQGHYTSYIHGVRVRSSDDEHISTAGGELLRGALLPRLVDLGLPAYRADARHVA